MITQPWTPNPVPAGPVGLPLSAELQVNGPDGKVHSVTTLSALYGALMSLRTKTPCTVVFDGEEQFRTDGAEVKQTDEFATALLLFEHLMLTERTQGANDVLRQQAEQERQSRLQEPQVQELPLHKSQSQGQLPQVQQERQPQAATGENQSRRPEPEAASSEHGAHGRRQGPNRRR